MRIFNLSHDIIKLILFTIAFVFQSAQLWKQGINSFDLWKIKKGKESEKLKRTLHSSKPFCFQHGYFQADDLPLSMDRHIYKKYPAISKRSSILSISEYKEVSYSDQMGTKIL